MLVHHTNPLADGVGGAVDLRGLTADNNLPLVGMIQPVQNVHQRALACAVFSQQGVDLSLFQSQVDVITGQHAGKLLGDVA